MHRAGHIVVASLITLALTACAAQPAPDLNPPPAKRLDAKTTLENGPRR